MSVPIEIIDLVVAYGKGQARVDALRGVSLSVEQGKVVGFLGPNGSGKTTTLHVMLGFVAATSGEVRLFGEDVRKSVARQRIGYLPEDPETYKFLTGRELLAMAGRLFGLKGAVLRGRIDDLIEKVGLADGGGRRISTYSRGMRQRISFAQALINDPDLVILDEPTGGLDPLGRLDVRGIIADLRRRGKTVFFSSHELSEVEKVCDQIIILCAGRIVTVGAVSELVQEGESLEQYFLQVVKPGAEQGDGSL